MLPQEKALVKRRKSRPFALVGIQSDGDAKECKAILEREGISWRNLPDGVPGGPIANAWNVTGWPTIFVLDAKGVIRFRYVQDHELDAIVERLVREAEAASPPRR